MTRAEATLATEKAVRNLSRKEIIGAMKMAGYLPEKERTKKKNRGACVFCISDPAVSKRTVVSWAEDAVALLRKHQVVVLYDRHYSPDRFTVLRENCDDVCRLLDAAYIPYREL